jgi:uncharacterized protein YjbI with pentapeptide repeats/sugar lactone lactonase YvrE
MGSSTRGQGLSWRVLSAIVVVLLGIPAAAELIPATPASASTALYYTSSFEEPCFAGGVAVGNTGDVYVTTECGTILQYSPAGVLLKSFGASNGVYFGNGPQGIAVDAAGDIYFAGAAGPGQVDSEIVELDPSGNVIATFGSYGSGPGQLQNPTGVAVDSAGNVYVADLSNFRIEAFAPDGSYLWATPGAGYVYSDMYGATFLSGFFSGPSSIAVNSTTGIVYALDPGNYRVESFSSSTGGFLDTFGSEGSGPGEFTQPESVAVDPNTGDVYVSDNATSQIEQFAPDGSLLSEWGSSGSGPDEFETLVPSNGIAVDQATGDLAVVDNVEGAPPHGRVQTFSSTAPFANVSVTGSEPATAGSEVVYSVVVSGASLPTTATADVSDGAGGTCTATLTSGVGSCAIEEETAGSYSVTATYDGTATLGRGSGSWTEIVGLAAAQVQLTGSEPATAGTEVTYAVDLAGAGSAPAPTGSVTISDGTGGSCVAMLTNAQGSCPIEESASGNYDVTATYGGDANYANGATGSWTEDVSPAPAPPGAPTGVIVDSVGNATAMLSWTASVSNSGPVLYYSVDAIDVTNLNNSLSNLIDANPATTTFAISGLTNGDFYSFEVNAFNTVGESPTSTPTPNTVIGIPPGAPTGVVVDAAGNTTATLSWTAPVSDGGPIYSYVVQAYDVTNPNNSLYNVPEEDTSTTNVKVEGLTNGDTYYFEVNALNDLGEGPPSSPSAHAVVGTVPSAPIGVVVDAVGNATATLSWTAPASNGGPVLHYDIEAFKGGLPTVGSQTLSVETGPLTSASIDGLTNGDAYSFEVIALNAAGEGPASSPTAPTVVGNVPSPPTGVVVDAVGNATARVSWTASVSNSGPILSYSVEAFDVTNPNNRVQIVGENNPTTTTLAITGLTNGDSYDFELLASNAVGESAASSPSAQVVVGLVPSAPSDVVIHAVGNTTATVSWAPPVSDGGPIVAYWILGQDLSHPTTGTVFEEYLDPTSTTYTASGLVDDDLYSFTVQAMNLVGASAFAPFSSDVVIRANSGTSITTSLDPVDPNVSVTYTATVSPAPTGGTVAFFDGGEAIAGCTAKVLTARGTATCSQKYTASGNHSIFAVYTPSSGSAGSSSPTIGETVAVCGSLQGCDLQNANLTGADLAGDGLQGDDLQGANLTAADLAGDNLQGDNLQGDLLTGTNLSGANLNGANLDGANAAGANLAGDSLQGDNLSASNFTAADLAGANLAGANLEGTTFELASLSHADLQGANMQYDNFLNASLSGAVASGASLQGITWTNTTCPDGTNSNNDGDSCVNHM